MAWKPKTPLSLWSNRFLWTALIHGFIATFIGISLVIVILATSAPQSYADTLLSNPIAGFTEQTALGGYAMYIVLGVLSAGVAALFYHHVEVTLGKRYHGLANTLAWTHLLLTSIGITAGTWIMIYAGYVADFALGVEGGGMTNVQARDQILMPLLLPVTLMFLLALVGFLAGGVGFYLTLRREA